MYLNRTRIHFTQLREDCVSAFSAPSLELCRCGSLCGQDWRHRPGGIGTWRPRDRPESVTATVTMAMFVLALVAAVLVTAGPAQVQAQQGRNQECVTPSGFIGRCRFGLCPLPNGGPSPVCERGYSCCVHVTNGRPIGGTPQRGTPPRRRRPTLATAAPPRRRTLLNPQFECGGQPAPERMMMMDPSAIIFPRTKRQAPEPTPKPDKSIAFVAGGAPEPGKTAVGVGVIGPRSPSRPSIQDVLERIGSRPKPPRRAPSFQGLSVSAPAPPPPPPPPSSSGRRGGGGSFFNPPSQSSSRRGSGGGGFFNLFSQPPRPNSIRRNPPRRRNNFQPNRNFNRRRGRGNGRQNYYQPRRYYNNRRPRRYHSPPRNYHDNYQQTYYQPPRRAYNRPRRGLLDQVLSIFGLSPQRGRRRRYRRSPQSPAEADSFETVWQEYQERVRSGDAPAGYTREELLEAYRAAAAEAAAESGGDTGNGGGWTCGAVLISERYMLTAAHCLLAGRPQVVRLGDLNLTSSADGAPQEYLVQEVIPHPRYKHPLVYHDLALLKLDRTVTFSEFVKPFCLFDGRSSLVDRVSHVSGWGATEFGGDLSDVLMGGNVTIWSQPRCDAVYTRQPGFLRRLPDGITSDLLCAGGEEQDACQGDSGGPMTVLTERGTRLAGVVSAGIGCASPGIPGLYTNVANYIDWIDSVVYGDGTA